MYLNYLEENEKVAFLKLAHAIAYSDGNFCENEKVIIGSYCNEMGIKNIELGKNEILVSDISLEFNSVQSKKIVILELISIINANGEFNSEEKEIIDILLNSFNLSNDFFENALKWSNAMLQLIEQGTQLIQS